MATFAPNSYREELFTKSELIEKYPQLSSYLRREIVTDLSPLDDIKRTLLDSLTPVKCEKSMSLSHFKQGILPSDASSRSEHLFNSLANGGVYIDLLTESISHSRLGFVLDQEEAPDSLFLYENKLRLCLKDDFTSKATKKKLSMLKGKSVLTLFDGRLVLSMEESIYFLRMCFCTGKMGKNQFFGLEIREKHNFKEVVSEERVKKLVSEAKRIFSSPHL